ncbi:tyrosine-protein phosphatase non-receptor type 9 isoform X2 [Piliocolobus tephrosceles]|uniref:Tyrosine-protein phosphatase non-receptor type 9 n=1 Tax=Macaca fascicularis TaxID=9541 RepID=A0A2K5TJK0_MACFA|nr:tyrosine-protein phosphatase non-receptor type 9 isoform X2 [Piliocolobus tephrosceles]XP_033046861.1 tyrosine-protein phosphatase non-receptor type 9 isoform X2 [Trachypithecus francoisi]
MEPATAPRPDMAPELTPEEEQATKQFLEEINKWTVQYNVSPLSWNVAVKFLMARKFDVLRAIELFHSYRETRRKEGIVKLKPHEEPLRSEILSGKFTILNVRDPTGASIALFTARLHHPHKSVQHVVLQALFYLLDRAVDSFETQRNGLVFIYDMCGSNYANFELDLGKKVLNLLKGAFPARLKKVLIVGAPIWFRVPYSIISLLLKDKVRERIQILKTSEVTQHLPRECLPENLDWDSVHVPGPHAMTIQELVDYVNARQKQGIYEEYEDIRRENPVGTFHCSMSPGNLEKNRYGDVPCLDQTRVKLTKRSGHTQTDYINASFMDGYKQKNAYIGTQGPLENTYRDFWLMVWEQKVLVIVMTTRFEEGGRRKCGQYWPLEKDSRIRFGFLTVTNLGVENMNHYKKTTLEIHNTEERQKRQVTHFQFLSWPDYGVPSSAASLIDFLRVVRNQQSLAVSNMGARSKGQCSEPPIVVHCSAGIGRTGTFCSLDICLAQLEELGTLNVFQTVSRMRTQRAFSIQTPEQYYFCYKAILEFAEKEGMVSSGQNLLAVEGQ